jgi:hypothetical protein
MEALSSARDSFINGHTNLDQLIIGLKMAELNEERVEEEVFFALLAKRYRERLKKWYKEQSGS